MQPTSEQMRRFARDPHDGPLVMLNLLEFRERAAYPPDTAEHATPCSGAEAYARYQQGVLALGDDPAIGVSELYRGPVAGFFIGEGHWDEVWIMRYPSRRHFLAMIGDPRYAEAHRHRDAGLLRQDLIETRPR